MRPGAETFKLVSRIMLHLGYRSTAYLPPWFKIYKDICKEDPANANGEMERWRKRSESAPSLLPSLTRARKQNENVTVTANNLGQRQSRNQMSDKRILTFNVNGQKLIAETNGILSWFHFQIRNGLRIDRVSPISAVHTRSTISLLFFDSKPRLNRTFAVVQW